MFRLNCFLLVCFLNLTIQLTIQSNIQTRQPQNLATDSLETIESTCSIIHTVKLHFYSTADRLVAYFELPFNETHKELIYQETATLDFNFDLSPRVILFKNRNLKIIRISNGASLKAFYEFERLNFLVFNSSYSSKEIFCLNAKRPLLSCFIRNNDYCQYADSFNATSQSDAKSFDLPATLKAADQILETVSLDTFHFPITKELICFKDKQLYRYDPVSGKRPLLASHQNKLTGLTFAHIRNQNERNQNERNWLIFGSDGLSGLQPHESIESPTSKQTAKGQPNSIYFGCAQPFCTKATFDDIVYDAVTNQLIIYRGPYFYEVPA